MREQNISRRRALPALCALLAACAPLEQGEKTAAADAPPLGVPDCFNANTATDFQALDRRTLVVYAPSRRQAYLVRIAPSSPDLRFSDGIGFTSRNGRICGYAGERVVFDHAGIGPVISVVDVRRLGDGEEEILLARYGRGSGVEPEPGNGPAIESPVDGEADGEGTAEDAQPGG